MDSVQDLFIQKRLLYKFDKKIDAILQQYFRRINEPSQQSSEMVEENQNNINRGMTKQELLDEIDQLMFQNFKYRTAVLSAKKDQQFNQKILLKEQQQISKTKQQIKQLSNDLNNAMMAKRHKQQYNVLATNLKKYQQKAIQDQKLKQIEQQIKNYQQTYQKEMQQYKKKQKCLKIALAALKGVIQWDDQKFQQTNQNQKLKQPEKQNLKLGQIQKNQREEGESDVFY